MHSIGNREIDLAQVAAPIVGAMMSGTKDLPSADDRTKFINVAITVAGELLQAVAARSAELTGPVLAKSQSDEEVEAYQAAVIEANR